MIHNIIFDWSGTLVDDLGFVLTATNALFRDFGRPEMSLSEFRAKFRLPLTEFYAETLPEATEGDIEILYERFFAKLQRDIRLLPGARKILDFCKTTGRRSYLLSTIRHHRFESQADRLGVRNTFTHTYTQIFDKREKIREILAINSLNPAETIFVGDMVHDIETARYGGIRSVVVLTGFDPPTKLISASPDLLIRNLEVLLAFL